MSVTISSCDIPLQATEETDASFILFALKPPSKIRTSSPTVLPETSNAVSLFLLTGMF